LFPQPKPNTPRKPTNYNKNLFTDDFAKSFSSVEATNLGDQFKYYNKNKNGKTKIMNYTTETIKTTKNLNNSGNPRKNINTTGTIITTENLNNSGNPRNPRKNINTTGTIITTENLNNSGNPRNPRKNINTTGTIITTENLNNSGNPRKNINTTENLIKNEKYYNTMLRQFKKFKIIGEEQYKKMKKLFDEFKFNKSILDKIKFTS